MEYYEARPCLSKYRAVILWVWVKKMKTNPAVVRSRTSTKITLELEIVVWSGH
jgi:hypothetical protein